MVAVDDELTVPNVAVVDSLDTELPVVIVPPNAQPSDPLPPDPVFAPGTPEPAYAVVNSTHPFNEDAESIVDPGTATHAPASVPENLTSNLETEVLINLNVKYCVPVLPADKSGPTGK